MLTVDTAESILTLYGYKLPFSVAEYFCYAFRDKIVCKKTINYKHFKEFLKYKENLSPKIIEAILNIISRGWSIYHNFYTSPNDIDEIKQLLKDRGISV